MTTTETPDLEAFYPAPVAVTVELGCLFATLHASVVGGRAVGAHVDLDGNILGDTNLESLHGDEPLYVARMLRAVMVRALTTARTEIGGDADVDEARQVVAKAVPLIPIVEAMVAAGVQVS